MNELPFSLKREPEQWADLYQLIKLANITAESEEIMNSNFKQTAKRFMLCMMVNLIFIFTIYQPQQHLWNITALNLSHFTHGILATM